MSAEKHQPNDFDVLLRIRQGDIDSFKIILTRYRDCVLQIVANRIPPRQVEEITQDVFIKAYRSLSSFKGNCKFANWLSRIAIRACYDYWRAHYRRRERNIGFFSEDQQTWLEEVTNKKANWEFDRMATRREAQELLDLILNKLTLKERVVLEMTYLEGRSIKETAELLGWSSSKVRVCSHRSRKKLRSFLRRLLTSGSPR